MVGHVGAGVAVYAALGRAAGIVAYLNGDGHLALCKFGGEDHLLAGIHVVGGLLTVDGHVGLQRAAQGAAVGACGGDGEVEGGAVEADVGGGGGSGGGGIGEVETHHGGLSAGEVVDMLALGIGAQLTGGEVAHPVVAYIGVVELAGGPVESGCGALVLPAVHLDVAHDELIVALGVELLQLAGIGDVVESVGTGGQSGGEAFGTAQIGGSEGLAVDLNQTVEVHHIELVLHRVVGGTAASVGHVGLHGTLHLAGLGIDDGELLRLKAVPLVGYAHIHHAAAKVAAGQGLAFHLGIERGGGVEVETEHLSLGHTFVLGVVGAAQGTVEIRVVGEALGGADALAPGGSLAHLGAAVGVTAFERPGMEVLRSNVVLARGIQTNSCLLTFRGVGLDSCTRCRARQRRSDGLGYNHRCRHGGDKQ